MSDNDANGTVPSRAEPEVVAVPAYGSPTEEPPAEPSGEPANQTAEDGGDRSS